MPRGDAAIFFCRSTDVLPQRAAWPRLLVASLCAPSDKKLNTGLCLCEENPRARFPTPTRRRVGRATRAFGLTDMCHSPRVACWPPPGHAFQLGSMSPPVRKPPAACSMGRAPPPPPPPPTSVAQVIHGEVGVTVKFILQTGGFNGAGLAHDVDQCDKLTSRELSLRDTRIKGIR